MKGLLQEWMGYLLLPDTSMQKIAMLIGPKRSGKGTISRIITSLIGRANVVTPTLGSLSKDFGTEPLIGKQLAIAPDARISGWDDSCAIVEKLLSISGEDSQTIHRKHRSACVGKLPTRLMILANERPTFRDASGAIASRMLMLNLTESFYGNEDGELFKRLEAELPGILLWAIEGWQRLMKRGRFDEPKSSREAAHDYERDSSPVREFVEDECEVSTDIAISKPELYERYWAWCAQKGRKAGPDNVFFRDLRAAYPRVKMQRKRGSAGSVHSIIGIRPRPHPPVDYAIVYPFAEMDEVQTRAFE